LVAAPPHPPVTPPTGGDDFDVWTTPVEEPAPSVRSPVPRRRAGAVAAVLALVVSAGLAAGLTLTRGGSAREHTTLAVNAVGLIGSPRSPSPTQLGLVGRPAGIATGAGSVWVSDAAAGQVVRFDPLRHVAVDRIPIGGDPSGLAFADGSLWVVDAAHRRVVQISAASGAVLARVPVGTGPSAIAAGEGALWVANTTDGTITRIDPLRARASGTIDLGQAPKALAVADGAVWATSEASGLLLQIDAIANSVVQAIPVGNGPGAVTAGDQAIWVSNGPDDTVSRIDPKTGSIRKINVEDPAGLAFAGDRVWVASGLQGLVSILDPSSGRRVETIAIGSAPDGLTPLGSGIALVTRASVAAHRGGTLRVVSTGEALDSIDPGTSYSLVGWQLLSMVYDGLVTYERSAGPSGATIVPDLATAVPVPRDGGKAYTFHLRPGIRYSDGRPVRAEDFRYAVEREFAAGTGLSLLGVDLVGSRRCRPVLARCDLRRGIVTNEESSTITFHLRAPDPAFLYKLALPFGAAVPTGSPRVSGSRPLPATGPYMIAGYQANRLVVLTRNHRFRQWSADAQPQGFPDRITVRLGIPPERQVALVSRGAADVMLDPPPRSRLQDMWVRFPTQAHAYVEPTVFGMFMNTRLPPFDRLSVRRALNFAVDRDKVVGIWAGPELSRPTCQILPPEFPGYRPVCPYGTHPGRAGTWTGPDVARARRLIGRSHTAGTPVTVWTSGEEPAKVATARYFVGLLRQLGYRATLRVEQDVHDYYMRIGLARTRAQIGVVGWAGDYPAGSSFYLPLFSCSGYTPAGPFNTNASAFCSAPIDRAMRRAARLEAIRPTVANQLWQEIERRLTGLAPWVPLINPAGLDFTAKRVGNYQRSSRYGILLSQLWVK
ncbi:MAG: ABC transporter substrate-binding protein, partial [Chloroflexota bacterium]|nr:ABC transporter substrate-binding protein [Chloroflexota bacterium]